MGLDGWVVEWVDTGGAEAMRSKRLGYSIQTWWADRWNLTCSVLVLQDHVFEPWRTQTNTGVTVKATGGGLVTIGRNSQNINSLAADGTLSSGNAVQLVFVDSTIGFLEI